MKTSIIVLSALFASSEAVKISDKSKFMPVDLIDEVGKEVNDTNYLEIGVNVRQELQSNLRNYLNDNDGIGITPNTQAGMSDRIAEATRPAPGTEHMTTDVSLTRPERYVENRFTHRQPYERWPAWVLPGSEPIMPKKSAKINLLDDELDMHTDFHYLPIYAPEREPLTHLELMNVQISPINEDNMVQVETESAARAQVRSELRSTLRAYLQREMKYPFDKFPATVLPGSAPILPKKSDPIDLYDGQMDNQWHQNHRSVYNPRTHAYDNWSLVQTDMQDDGEITV